MSLSNLFNGKRILITGVCGTVGSELLRQLCLSDTEKPAEIRGIDNNESSLFFLDQSYLDDERVNLAVCDIRDGQSLAKLMNDIDIVFHAAALKHVILSERSPYQAVQTNILGVQNIIEAAEANQVGRVIFTSSDKAVNPTNVMGTSKLMGERLMTAANSGLRTSTTVYASTRFGNVLGSSGSVFPIFKKQIESGGPITITHPEMTRFVMSIEDSVKLVLDTAKMAKGGEIFVTKMPVVRIVDLAQAMIKLFASGSTKNADEIEIVEIGTKPGEKLYEELMSDEETRRAMELENYFTVLPAFRGIYNKIDYDFNGIISRDVTDPYNSSSQQVLGVDEIVRLLENYGLTSDSEAAQSSERYWPGDKETTTGL